MSVYEQKATVYVAPTSGRRFLTLNGALCAEARAIIQSKYPSDRGSKDDSGRYIGDGFYWRDDLDRSEVLYRRILRKVKKSYRDLKAAEHKLRGAQ